jgi:AcrR family transcriptional regulator
MTTTRREIQRAATRREILETARAQIAEQGAAGLSLRAIARTMQLTAPALYRYFRDRDELVTALIIEAFNALADAMAAAGRAPAGDRPAAVADRLLAMCLAYRDWAVAHPQDYLLIFGTPIPGYTAPAEITAPAAKRCFDVIVAAMPAYKRGPRPYRRLPAALQAQVVAWRSRYGYDIDSAALLYALVAWTRMHGLVSLELVGQIEPFFGDASALYHMEMGKLIAEAGWQPGSRKDI